MPSVSAFFLTLLPLLTSSAVGLWLVQNELLIKHFGFKEWILVCLFCIFTCAVALTPPTLLSFVFGYFLGWIGFFPLIFINLAAIALVFGVSQNLNHASLRAYLSQFSKVQPFLNRLEKNEVRFVFFTKLSPVLPFALTNLLFGLIGLRLRNVLLGGFLGMIPRTALAVWVGSEAQQIAQLIQNPDGHLLSRLLVVGFVIVSVWGLIRVFLRD
jgi:uncharacterized membrane protein YdjX (TVP38/TMEM64 family)